MQLAYLPSNWAAISWNWSVIKSTRASGRWANSGTRNGTASISGGHIHPKLCQIQIHWCRKLWAAVEAVNGKQVGSLFLAGAARSHTPMSTIYFHSGDRLSWGDISDTRTMRWGILLTHAVWSYATLRRRQRVAGPLQPFAAAKICGQTYIHR